MIHDKRLNKGDESIFSGLFDTFCGVVEIYVTMYIDIFLDCDNKLYIDILLTNIAGLLTVYMPLISTLDQISKLAAGIVPDK